MSNQRRLKTLFQVVGVLGFWGFWGLLSASAIESNVIQLVCMQKTGCTILQLHGSCLDFYLKKKFFVQTGQKDALIALGDAESKN